MERLVRTIAIWVCGLVASAIVGGGIGSSNSGVVGAIGATSDAASNAEAWVGPTKKAYNFARSLSTGTQAAWRCSPRSAAPDYQPLSTSRRIADRASRWLLARRNAPLM